MESGEQEGRYVYILRGGEQEAMEMNIRKRGREDGEGKK